MSRVSKIHRNGKNTLGNTNTNVLGKDRSRGWCWTLNNYSEEEYEMLTHPTQSIFQNCKWIVGKEIGKQGTPHLQGYFYFNNAVNFKTIKEYIPKAHIEKAKGTPLQNYDYCRKEGNFLSSGFDSIEKPKKHKITDLWKIEVQEALEEQAIEWLQHQREVDETYPDSDELDF